MPLAPDVLAARARRIRLAVFDVDGVLTDGLLHYGPEGEAWKTFHVRDGHGIVLLRLAGVPSAVLTGRESEAVRARMRELGVRHVVTGCRDKGKGLEALLARAGVAAEEAAYMGDDVNDLPAFDRAGLSACPADADASLLARADLVVRAPGGRGAARELCDLLLAHRGR
jgi:3-deoxy-D-manno-octulosonate 8-phosphate phosphatase (KDO 8-P phosphatase)